MEPMKPMQPLAPMEWARPWWPQELGDATASGGQNRIRYAFFSSQHRLLIERDGRLETYDSGDHLISGVAQQSGSSNGLVFTSQRGTVDMGSLQKVE